MRELLFPEARPSSHARLICPPVGLILARPSPSSLSLTFILSPFLCFLNFLVHCSIPLFIASRRFSVIIFFLRVIKPVKGHVGI